MICSIRRLKLTETGRPTVGHDIGFMMLFLAIRMNKSSHDTNGVGTEVGT
jgi:hypothetical protein